MENIKILSAKSLPDLEVLVNTALSNATAQNKGAYVNTNIIVVPEHHIFGPGPTFAVVVTTHDNQLASLPPQGAPSEASTTSGFARTLSSQTDSPEGAKTSDQTQTHS